jgi:hypothetical protein
MPGMTLMTSAVISCAVMGGAALSSTPLAAAAAACWATMRRARGEGSASSSFLAWFRMPRSLRLVSGTDFSAGGWGATRNRGS